MNTSTFIETLILHTGKKLEFVLPNETVLSGDLHITEIQHHSIKSVDCGGNPHSYYETVVQLSINERSNTSAIWTVEKAIKIIDVVANEQSFVNDAEVLIEFGDSNHPTIRYSIGKIEAVSEMVSIHMRLKSTVCKPSLNVGKELESCC